jgi:hypothetical protein
VQLDLGPHVRRALRQPTKALQILRSDETVVKERRAALAKQVGALSRLAAHIRATVVAGCTRMRRYCC